jgi:tetratricopeptide (TPR) repeat protein
MSEHELWNELGNLYFLSGAYGQAVHAYHRSIQLDDRFGRPYSNLALTYVQQGKFEEAVDLYRRSIELLSESKEKAISWNRLGNVYRYLRDYRQAVIAYQQADELDPENPEGRGEPGRLSADGSPELPNMEGRIKNPISTDDHDPWDAAFDSDMNQRLVSPDDVAASWALTGPTPLSELSPSSPPTGALTTWGDPNLDDDDFEPFLPFEQETEFRVPEAGQDDLIPWMPIPEEPPEDTNESTGESDAASAMPALVPPAQVRQTTRDQLSETNVENLAGNSGSKTAQSIPSPDEMPAGPETAPSLPFARGTGTNPESPQEAGQRSQPAVELAERRPAEFVLAVRDPRAQAVAGPAQASERGRAPGSFSDPKSSSDAVEVNAERLERDPRELKAIEAELAKYERVVQINPRNARAWDALGNLYKNAGRYPDALLAYQQAISNDASRAVYHHHLGLVYACQGRDEDAISAFQHVIEIDPEHSLAHATLGGYYRKMGLEELAQKHIGKAMKSIFDSENEYNRACLAAICGRADEALDLLRVALNNKQTYVDWILRDPDLDFIRHDPRFKQLISDYTR